MEAGLKFHRSALNILNFVSFTCLIWNAALLNEQSHYWPRCSASFFCLWECPVPSPAHHTWGGSSMVSSQLRGCSLHGLWQVTSSVSTPPLFFVELKRARILRDFFISIYKAFCLHQTGGNRDEWTFIIATQLSVSSKLCCCGHNYLHMLFGRYRQMQSPAWVVAWLRSCLASLLLQGHTTLGTGLVSWAVWDSPTSPPTFLALCLLAPPVTLTREHSSDLLFLYIFCWSDHCSLLPCTAELLPASGLLVDISFCLHWAEQRPTSQLLITPSPGENQPWQSSCTCCISVIISFCWDSPG